MSRSNPEAVWACQTCAVTCMALQYTRIRLVTQEHISKCSVDQPPNSPTRNTSSCSDLSDGLEDMQRACMHAPSDADSLNIPAKVSDTLDLPPRGSGCGSSELTAPMSSVCCWHWPASIFNVVRISALQRDYPRIRCRYQEIHRKHHTMMDIANKHRNSITVVSPHRSNSSNGGCMDDCVDDCASSG